MGFEKYVENQLPHINRYIDTTLKKYRSHVSNRFGLLIDAIQYSLEGTAKRVRPMLAFASAECLGVPVERILPAACAVEFIHTYSLIHDDLPAMDDDDMRRGKPSSHRKFGEAVAILAGDALLTEAFSQMAQLSEHSDFEPRRVLSAIELLTQYSGIRGMVGGQLLDVTLSEKSYTVPEVEFVHIHKTGAMILASVLLPAVLVGVDNERLRNFRRYGETMGLAFQVSDDLLDADQHEKEARRPGKRPGPTFTTLLSRSEIREKMNSLVDSAIEYIRIEGQKAEALIDIAEFIRHRKQ